jgi:hypothetical protein
LKEHSLGYEGSSICEREDYEDISCRNISARQGTQKPDISEEIAGTKKDLHEELIGTQVEMKTTPRGLESRKEKSRSPS